MRNLLFIMTIFFTVASFAQSKQLKWEKDLNTVKELSKSENKPILMYYSKSDCAPCEQFYSDVFKQDKFDALSKKFVLLMVDGSYLNDKSNDVQKIKQRRLLNHYNPSSSFPSITLVNTDGQPIGEQFKALDKASIATYSEFLKTL